MKQKLLITCVFFSVLFYECSTPKSSLDYASSGNESIPQNFNPATGVLLIEQSIEDDNSSVNLSTSVSGRTDDYMNYYMKKNKNAMIEYANKNYPSKHEFASQDDIYSPSSKYGDKNTYQFALVTSLVKPNQYTKVYTDGRMPQSTYNQPVFKFYIYDRLNDKTYAALGHGSSLIMWAFKDAIKKISGGK